MTSRNKRTKLSLTLLAGFMLTGATAFADDGFGCLRKLQGGTVRWDMDWQRDRADHDVQYRIVGISESQPQRNLHEVAVELLAVGPATIQKRVSRIRMDHAAELFCRRASPVVTRESTFVQARSEFTKPVSERAPVTPFTAKDLPFRAYSEGQWKAAREPVGQPLKVCATTVGVFACNEADHAKLLIRSSGDLAGRGKLTAPFIRFVDGGWVRGSEADLPRLGNVSDCSIYGRKFRCLEDEKNAYGPLLKQLEERASKRG